MAIIVQDFSGYIPGCIFNQMQWVYYTISVGLCLLLCFTIVVVLRAKTPRPLFIITTCVLMIVVMEGAVRLFDRFFVVPQGIGGQSYQRDSVFLPRPTPTNSLGFNSEREYTKQIPANTTRFLFLGDSYTYGSASHSTRSYCHVIESFLNRNGNGRYEVFNAGVPGYSPLNSYKLLRFLIAEGYEYDAVVFSLFMQNDFIEEVPHTYRTPILGIPQRQPRNPLLRIGHPLNSYLFRYIITAPRFLASRTDSDRPQPGDNPTGPFQVSEIAVSRFQMNYFGPPDLSSVLFSIKAMAAEGGKPFFLVIFPDQFFGDKRVREEILSRVDGEQYDFRYYYRWIDRHFAALPRLDLSHKIATCDDCYISNDTHLNDRGNKVAGEVVGTFLLSQNLDSFHIEEQRAEK
ncbi:SGNH/GDSL hydrolase family protein [Candidatus Thiosymbion oneisti]|uniref:SGNH/GDSL hydrolase family protein n=1 Tax=Candidatus Thiosymbion oneisti TaxID=589554 RepID=UPI00105F5B87|nr:SGNH/GDSL hydrolase family protein [Candidatus Thiosymbion oneisti]